MKREDTHPGQMLWCKGLGYTKRYIGTSEEMNEFKKSYILIEDFDTYYTQGVKVRHSDGIVFTIHCGDLMDPDDLLKGSESAKIIKMTGKKVHFDETRLIA